MTGRALTVDSDLLPVLLEGGIQDALGVAHAGVGNEAVNLAKVLDHLVDGALDAVGVGDVDLVGLGLDAVLLRQLLGLLDGRVVGVVPQRNVGASLGHALSHGSTDALGGAVDDDDAVGHLELVDDVDGGVGEGLGEALADDAGILRGHRHGCGVFWGGLSYKIGV